MHRSTKASNTMGRPAHFRKGRRALTWGVWVCASLTLALLVITSVHPALFQDVTSIKPTDSGALATVTEALKKLLQPAQLVMLGAAPIGTVAGAVLTMFGHKKGMTYVLASIGGLLLVSAGQGIIA